MEEARIVTSGSEGVRSMPMCIDAIDVYTYGEDIYRVCLRIIRMDVTYGLEDGS